MRFILLNIIIPTTKTITYGFLITWPSINHPLTISNNPDWHESCVFENSKFTINNKILIKRIKTLFVFWGKRKQKANTKRMFILKSLGLPRIMTEYWGNVGHFYLKTLFFRVNIGYYHMIGRNGGSIIILFFFFINIYLLKKKTFITFCNMDIGKPIFIKKERKNVMKQSTYVFLLKLLRESNKVIGATYVSVQIPTTQDVT